MGCGIEARVRLILSLCDQSGVWSQPYADAGYAVVRVDLAHPNGLHQIEPRLWHWGEDVRNLNLSLIQQPYAILAAPPCTVFCRPGARWWPRMDSFGTTERDVSVFRAVFALCQKSELWWALENPPGRQRKLMPELPAPSWQWQPWQYGDPWVKQTYIWGTANKPEPR